MRVICTLRTVRSPSGLCSFITVFHMKWLICPEDLIYSIWCWKKQQKLVLIWALASPPLSLFSGMFFDGNHTYMIEPGGHGSSNVSTADGSSQQGLSICPSSMFLHPAASTSCWAVWGQTICCSSAVLCPMSTHSPASSSSLMVPKIFHMFSFEIIVKWVLLKRPG